MSEKQQGEPSVRLTTALMGAETATAPKSLQVAADVMSFLPSQSPDFQMAAADYGAGYSVQFESIRSYQQNPVALGWMMASIGQLSGVLQAPLSSSGTGSATATFNNTAISPASFLPLIWGYELILEPNALHPKANLDLQVTRTYKDGTSIVNTVRAGYQMMPNQTNGLRHRFLFGRQVQILNLESGSVAVTADQYYRPEPVQLIPAAATATTGIGAQMQVTSIAVAVELSAEDTSWSLTLITPGTSAYNELLVQLMGANASALFTVTK